jgi:hypothetical protein
MLSSYYFGETTVDYKSQDEGDYAALSTRKKNRGYTKTWKDEHLFA